MFWLHLLKIGNVWWSKEGCLEGHLIQLAEASKPDQSYKLASNHFTSLLFHHGQLGIGQQLQRLNLFSKWNPHCSESPWHFLPMMQTLYYAIDTQVKTGNC